MSLWVARIEETIEAESAAQAFEKLLERVRHSDAVAGYAFPAERERQTEPTSSE